MQNQPVSSTITGTPLVQKDWSTFAEAVIETRPAQRQQMLESFAQYLIRENKLQYFTSVLEEAVTIGQHQQKQQNSGNSSR